ncbi:MAG: glycosyltransferase family 2 protein [Planctomycetota bacterium]
MSEPVLTVVVPCWNSEQFLGRCLASLAGVPAGSLEVIVVDNESSDNTRAIVEAHGGLVSQVISEPDRGQSDALNKGFRAATGRFVCWVNSDDEVIGGSLARIVSILEHAQGDWYTAGMVWIDEASRIVRCSPPLPHWPVLERFGATGIGGPSSFVRRAVVTRVGQFDERLHYSMDTDMWYRLHSQGVKLHALSFYVWAFRIHAASKTSHVHLGQRMNAGMMADRMVLARRYGFGTTRLHTAFLQAGTRALGLLSGRDFRAFQDTRCLRGRSVVELSCQRAAAG